MLRDGKLYISYSTDKMRMISGFFLLLCLGVLIIVGVSSPAVSVLTFAFCVAILLFVDLERAFCISFFLIPFATVFKLSPESASLFTYLEMVLVLRIIVKNSSNFDKRYFICFLIFAIYVTLGSYAQITTIIKQLMIPLLIFGFFRCYHSGLKRVLLYFAFGLLLSSIFAQFVDQIPSLGEYIILDQSRVDGEYVDRFSGLYSDPNYYSLALMMTITGLLMLFINKQIGNVSLILVLVLVIFGAQTVSKSFLLVLVAVLTLFVGLLFYRKRYFAGLVSLVVVFLLFVAALSGKIEIFNNVIERLSESTSSAESFTTGRTNGWEIYINHIFGDNVLLTLFGYGIGAGYPQHAIAAHNTYLDFLYYYGFVGSLLFVAVCRLAVPSTKNKAYFSTNILMWVILLVMIAFLSYLKFFDFGFMLILAILAYEEKLDLRKVM